MTMSKVPVFLLCLTALAGLPFNASAQVSAAASAPAAVSLADGYVLGIGDIVEVSVLGRDEFKPKTQIQADGTIQLPFIGIVDANNRTVLQLRDQVRRKLIAGGFYADPAVNVTVVGYSSRYIVVLGEVGTPGIVSIDRAYRVSEILARVGGAKSAGVDSITLTRQSGETINLSVTDVATGGADKDPVVNPGDKLYVAPARTFYIYGQVAAAGTYPIDRDMDLRKALARGGGLTALGSEKRVKVIRKGTELRNFNPGDPILDGDVIVVGERFF